MEYRRNFVWCVTGSLKTGKYIHGKSDIDLLLIPQRGLIGAKNILEIMKAAIPKYGTVYKKGRDISVFDILLWMDAKFQKQCRAALFKAMMEHKNLKHIGITREKKT